VQSKSGGQLLALMYPPLKIKILLIINVLFLSVLILSSYNSGQEDNFIISLTDSGEIVLSEHEIQAYHSDDDAFILNENGIKKWNSFLTYQTIPKLADSLFSREFVLKIEGQEICKGKFWSFASSTSYSGVVILDSLFKLDTEHNTLWIKSFSMSSNTSLDTAISSELISFFEKRNLQK